MFFLPSDILDIIVNEYLCIDSIINLSQTNKFFYNDCKIIKDKIKEKKEYVLQYFCPEIIELMGGFLNMIKFPICKWDRSYLGSSGYIDGINPSDIKHKIMIGRDELFNRSFITIKILTISPTKKKYYDITVLFQRYSDNLKTWATASSGIGFINESGHFMKNGIIKHDLIAINIYNLLNNNNTILEYIACSKDYQRLDIHKRTNICLSE